MKVHRVKSYEEKNPLLGQIIGFSQVLLTFLSIAISCPHSYVIVVTFSISTHFKYYYYIVAHFSRMLLNNLLVAFSVQP